MRSGRFAFSLECKAEALLFGTCFFARAGPLFHKVFLAGWHGFSSRLLLQGNIECKATLCLFFSGMQSGRCAFSLEFKTGALLFGKGDFARAIIIPQGPGKSAKLCV